MLGRLRPEGRQRGRVAVFSPSPLLTVTIEPSSQNTCMCVIWIRWWSLSRKSW